MAIEGSASAEIDAPIDEVYEIAADAAGVTRWQPEIRNTEVLERDAGGDQVLVHVETDAKVRTIGSDLRFSYDPPTGLSWSQVEGPLKSLDGSWKFEDLGNGRTRATYWLRVDLGRTLGMLVRGPLVDVLRNRIAESMPGKLKAYIEADR